MKIEAMILRENFYKILRNTMNHYFETVRECDASFKYEKTDEDEPLLVNSKFGFISRPTSPSGLKTYLRGEYNVRGAFLKNAAAKALILAIGIAPRIGTDRNAYVRKGILGENEFILPQNRSIRIFNYDTMTVDCIIKSGFTSRYFRNQMEFRKSHSYPFIPKLLEYGDDWFSEGIMTGHPLARTTDEVFYKKGFTDALEDMGVLVMNTRSDIKAKEYANRLLSSIKRMLDEAENRKEVKYAGSIRKIAIGVAQHLAKSQMVIPISVSHGDFQSGNIWVDTDGKTWIYDWEIVGVRSIWYDCTVLNYSLRRDLGWQMLLTDDTAAGMVTFDEDQNPAPEKIRIMKQTVLLEDIVFYLEDLLELPEDWGKDIFDRYALRISDLWDGTKYGDNEQISHVDGAQG